MSNPSLAPNALQKPLKRVKVAKKRRPLDKKTKPELIKEADKWFSRCVRLRDSDIQADGSWAGVCIDGCNKLIGVLSPEGKWCAGSNIGHFVGRGAMITRYDDENCNLQGAYCNAWRDKISMLEGYAKGLDMKYGDGTASKLKKLGKQECKLTREELLEIIHDSKAQVDFYTRQLL